MKYTDTVRSIRAWSLAHPMKLLIGCAFIGMLSGVLIAMPQGYWPQTQIASTGYAEELLAEQALAQQEHLLPSPTQHTSAPELEFPEFGRAVFPIAKVPNWGAMRTPEEWTRTFHEMSRSDFVPLPAYDLATLTTPLSSLMTSLSEENIATLTAKLTYSTRPFGSYDLDSDEFEGPHAGIDLKLAKDTPVGAMAGGRIHAIRINDRLGLHIIVEHHTENGETLYSVYGHLGMTTVKVGDDVAPGTIIGTVGMSGNTSNPHLHFQIDLSTGAPEHIPYAPASLPSPPEVERWTLHPIEFIEELS